MIEKSRLAELIKEGATIYTPFYTFCRISDLVKVMSYKLNKSFYIAEADGEERLMINFIDKNGNIQPEFIAYLQNLYETQKEAEWALKYQRITRTEELNLPTWEEFMQEDKMVAFTTYPRNYHLLKYGNYIVIRSFYGHGGMDIFVEPLTEENYIKACDLCVKLFKGEKDETND